MCELASWIPNAVAATLRDAPPQPILAWLTNLRESIEEYDPLVAVRPLSPDSEASSPDSAFDEILSHLGKEIFKLDQYQRSLAPGETEVSLSILNIFDTCLDNMIENKEKPDCSDGESTVTDISFVTSTPQTHSPRSRLKTDSTSSSYDVEIDKDCNEWTKLIESDSDSESTCWSYKECSDGEVDVNNVPYAAVWAQSSGFHNSDAVLREVLSQNCATVSRLSFDTADEFTPVDYSVYALAEVGDRCSVTMSPARPADDGYEPVRDAITDENIYEEIEFGCSFTDEGCSCGTSVEVESLSIGASSGRDSPLYANLRDHDAYAVSSDVIFWKNLLLDPYYNEDEEDEWITPEECAMYSRDQRPPLVIPRITQYRPPRQRAAPQHLAYTEDNGIKPPVRQYDRLGNWSPTSDRGRPDLERSFSKACTDSPPISRINKRLGGSTENLLVNARRPQHLQIPPSSSGDSLDVEIRDKDLGYGRTRKTMSMVAPKNRIRSPVPTPRVMVPHPAAEASVLLEGPVKRTKFFESGKKSKKNWHECYMVLTHTALYFYKDQRNYYASKVSKPPGTPPSPTAPRADLVLPLRNARVLQCKQSHTRRYNKSLVLIVDYDQYLIQDDTEEGAKRWHQAIETVILNLHPALHPDASPHYQSSNTDLESLGRTPPVSRHANRAKQKAGGSSNEDLSDSTEVSKSHVRSRLRKFFAKRPAMEVLVKKGIYKDEPVFGRNLDEVCPTTSPRVPDFVVACVKEIESSEENMCTDGLYRASGNLSQVQKIRLEIDQNNVSVIENNTDIHVLTGSLKLFFRELKEPLIPCSIFDRVLAACSIKPKEAKIKEFRDIIQSLPQCNRDTLKFLLEHLLNTAAEQEEFRTLTCHYLSLSLLRKNECLPLARNLDHHYVRERRIYFYLGVTEIGSDRVTQYSERNRMHTANLAIVFGPTLLWAPAEQAHNIAVDCIQQNNVVDILLNEFKEIFTEDNKSKKKA